MSMKMKCKRIFVAGENYKRFDEKEANEGNLTISPYPL